MTSRVLSGRIHTNSRSALRFVLDKGVLTIYYCSSSSRRSRCPLTVLASTSSPSPHPSLLLSLRWTSTPPYPRLLPISLLSLTLIAVAGGPSTALLAASAGTSRLRGGAQDDSATPAGSIASPELTSALAKAVSTALNVLAPAKSLSPQEAAEAAAGSDATAGFKCAAHPSHTSC